MAPTSLTDGVIVLGWLIVTHSYTKQHTFRLTKSLWSNCIGCKRFAVSWLHSLFFNLDKKKLEKLFGGIDMYSKHVRQTRRALECEIQEPCKKHLIRVSHGNGMGGWNPFINCASTDLQCVPLWPRKIPVKMQHDIFCEQIHSELAGGVQVTGCGVGIWGRGLSKIGIVKISTHYTWTICWLKKKRKEKVHSI